MGQVNTQHGVGLVEVLVAVLLLSVAVLGFSALQLQAIKATEESLVRTQALSVIRSLAENMRANPLQMAAYQAAINTPNASAKSCNALTDKCTAEEIATKEANAAVKKLKEYDITIAMVNCPSDASISDFSQIKCIIAAWGDTKALLNDAVDPKAVNPVTPVANACANEFGVYNSGSTCVIVEAY